MLQSIFETLPWATITPLTTMATFTALVWAGRLVPRSWVDKAAREQEERIRFLQETASAQAQTITSLTQQNHDLTVSAELSVALLKSLQDLNRIGTNHTRALNPLPGSDIVPSTETTG